MTRPTQTTNETAGKFPLLPAELRAWIGRQYGWNDRGLRPIAQPRPGIVYLTVRDPREGLQAVHIDVIKQDGALVVTWLSGKTAWRSESVFGPVLWWPIDYEPKAKPVAPVQSDLFRVTPEPKRKTIELAPIVDKRQMSLLGTQASRPVDASPIATWRGAMSTYLGILRKGRPSSDAMNTLWTASQNLAAQYGVDLSGWFVDSHLIANTDQWWAENIHNAGTAGVSAIVDVLAAEARAAATKLTQLAKTGRIDQPAVLAWIAVTVKMFQAAERIPGMTVPTTSQPVGNRWADNPEYSSSLSQDGVLELRAFPEGESFGWAVLTRNGVIEDRGYNAKTLKGAKSAAERAEKKLLNPKRQKQPADACTAPRPRKGKDAACRGDWDGIVSCVVRSGGLNQAAPEAAEIVWSAGDKKHVPPRLLRKTGGTPWYKIAAILTEQGYVAPDEHGRPDEAQALQVLVDAMRGGRRGADPRLNACSAQREQSKLIQAEETGRLHVDHALISELHNMITLAQQDRSNPPPRKELDHCIGAFTAIQQRFSKNGQLSAADKKSLNDMKRRCEAHHAKPAKRQTNTGRSTRSAQPGYTASEIRRAVEEATKNLPPGDYEVILH